MSLKTEWMRYGADREHAAYVAYPARAALPLPAVIVIQEAWGLDEHIEDVTRRFALAGYVALAPDLYAKGGERRDGLTRERLAELQSFLNANPTAWMDEKAKDAGLAKLTPDARARVAQTFPTMIASLKLEPYIPALTAATKFLRQEYAPSRGQKVGAVGFCMGGGLAGLLASADPDLAVAVIFYGSAPPSAQVAQIRCPVLGLYGEQDKRVNEGIPAFAEAMRQHGKTFESHIYAGAPHAFFNDERPSYHAGATRDSLVRTLAFLGKALA